MPKSLKFVGIDILTRRASKNGLAALGMDLWTDLVKRGEAAIHDLCAARAPESQQLELKRKSSHDSAGLGDDDKRALGENLSGMSNAEGGVLLFGVIDEKIDGLDCAKEPQPIKDVAAVAGAIRGLVPNYLSPANPDIEVLPVQCGKKGAGVIAIRIGRSDTRPHMSLAPTHHRFYLRVEATNQLMAGFQLRDMWSIKTAPILRVGYQLIARSNSHNSISSQIVLTLRNDGRVSTSQPYMIVRPATTIHCVGPASQQFINIPHADDSCRYIQGIGGVSIHPELEVPVAAFLATIRHEDGMISYRLDARGQHYVGVDACPVLEIKISVGAEDTPARDVEFSLTPRDLTRMANRLIRTRRPFQNDEWF